MPLHDHLSPDVTGCCEAVGDLVASLYFADIARLGRQSLHQNPV